MRAAGERRYNGRAERTIDALEAAGLVTVECETRLHAKGNGLTASRLLIVRPVPA